jgi:hypothetical protein
MNQNEKQVVVHCVALLEATLGPDVSAAKADQIVRSVAGILKSL